MNILLSFINREDMYSLARNLGLCPYCKKDVSGVKVAGEIVDYGQKARMTLTTIIPMDVHTTCLRVPPAMSYWGSLYR
jgi:hypothetical protein